MEPRIVLLPPVKTFWVQRKMARELGSCEREKENVHFMLFLLLNGVHVTRALFLHSSKRGIKWRAGAVLPLCIRVLFPALLAVMVARTPPTFTEISASLARPC
jgi:hypothetical protein